jgi:predicted HTH transcriptional regulator
VTLDQLRRRTSIHASRNPLIVRVFVEAGLMREEGEGIARMFDEMEASYLSDPELALEASTFTVTLRNEPIFAGVSPEWSAAVRRLSLSLAQRRALVAHPEGFTNEQYRALNGVDRDDAYREIQEMVKLGFVASARAAGRGATYRVLRDAVAEFAPGNARGGIAKPAIPAHFAPAWMADRVARLRQYFAHHAQLKNADYRELFELARDSAVRELRQLTKAGYLRMEGERRGARYLQGHRLEEPGK